MNKGLNLICNHASLFVSSLTFIILLYLNIIIIYWIFNTTGTTNRCSRTWERLGSCEPVEDASYDQQHVALGRRIWAGRRKEFYTMLMSIMGQLASLKNRQDKEIDCCSEEATFFLHLHLLPGRATGPWKSTLKVTYVSWQSLPTVRWHGCWPTYRNPGSRFTRGHWNAAFSASNSSTESGIPCCVR